MACGEAVPQDGLGKPQNPAFLSKIIGNSGLISLNCNILKSIFGVLTHFRHNSLLFLALR